MLNVKKKKITVVVDNCVTMECIGAGFETDAIMILVIEIAEIARTGLVALDRGRSNIYG